MTTYLPLIILPIWGAIVYLLHRAHRRRIQHIIATIRSRQEP